MSAAEIMPQHLYLGNSQHARFPGPEAQSVLNCAHDLMNHWQWPDVGLGQVPLVDGPGNPLAAYYAGVFQLGAMIFRTSVLVHCHAGQSRSVAIVVMYLHALNDGGWTKNVAMVREIVGRHGQWVIPENQPHPAHREAFDRMDFDFIRKVLKAEHVSAPGSNQ